MNYKDLENKIVFTYDVILHVTKIPKLSQKRLPEIERESDKLL